MDIWISYILYLPIGNKNTNKLHILIGRSSPFCKDFLSFAMFNHSPKSHSMSKVVVVVF